MDQIVLTESHIKYLAAYLQEERVRSDEIKNFDWDYEYFISEAKEAYNGGAR
jgi:hypothetical protein